MLVRLHCTPVNLHNSSLPLEKQFHFNIHVNVAAYKVYILLTNSHPWFRATETQQRQRQSYQGGLLLQAHLENRQETVIINLFIRGVSGKGPIRSTPMVCHTSPLTGIGWSSACRSLVKFSIQSERTNHGRPQLF